MARKTARDEELSRRPAIRKKLLKVFDSVDKGFENQRERADQTADYWDAYNCVLGPKQQFNGTSKLYLPIIHVAVNARATRFTNQMFPQNGRYVDVTSADMDGNLPLETVALIEHYVRDARLRTQVAPALCRAGDIEGQYNMYVHWDRVKRHVVHAEDRPIKIEGVEMPEAGTVTRMIEEEIEDSGPAVEIVPDTDVCVLPPTSDNISQALERNGTVTIVRRWSKSDIEDKIDAGEIEEDAGEELIASMAKVDDQRKDQKKSLNQIAGIKLEQGDKIAVVYETWVKLKVDGTRRLCRAYYGGEKRVLGCKLNPYWCDHAPLFSWPVDKLPGVFKGISKIRVVLDMQVYANDAINMSADGLPFHALPVLAVDPEKVQRWENLVLDVGAVWPVGADGMRVQQFPNVTDSAMQVVAAAKAQIFEALGVNPAMLPQQTGRPGAKRNQAEVALEQQVDILTTADAVTNIEGEGLTPFIQRALDYDHQFRDKDIQVKMFGQMGQRAYLQRVPPIQRHHRFVLSWLGVEAARDAARIQQMIAGANVLRNIPPEMYPGYRLNMIPIINRFVEVTYGASLGSQIFENVTDLYAIDPEEENKYMGMGFPLKTHPLDMDPKHLQSHTAYLQTLDPASTEYALTKQHIQAHQQAMQLKAIQAMGMQQQQRPGGPGQRGPQGGSQVRGQRGNGKGPPGMMHKDQLPAAGGIAMPRKM